MPAKEQNKLMDFDTELAKFTPRQMEACAAIDSGYKYILYGGALGGGKLLRLSTPLATPKGWTTMGEIRVGGQVFDEAGNVCNVIAVSKEQTDKTFSIVFSDGAEIIAGASHEWVTETAKDRDKITRRTDKYRAARRAKRGQRGTGRRPDLARRNASQIYKYLPPVVPTIKTTQEIHDTLMAGREKNHSIPVCGPLSLPIADLPIPPYVLGAWLGDGCSTSGQIAGIDNQIMAEIRACGYEVRDHSKASSHGIIGLKKQLQEIGVYANKHIPLIYLRAAIPQRLALLQGLMDTDGHCDARGQCEIQVVSKPLADGIRELICSLGIKVKMCTGRAMLYGRECGEKYRLKFITGLPAFRLRRKIERQKRTDFRGTHQRRYIISVTEIAAEPMKCIQVDSPSAMYLCGKDMIPTHNSYLLRWLAVRILLKIFDDFQIRNAAVMLACEDYPTLKDRQISKIATEFPSWLGTYHNDHKIYGKAFIIHPRRGGGIICLRNLDDPSKYQSAEFLSILVDELTKNDISVFTDLRSRLRWKGVPDYRCVFVGATNPGGIGHNFCKAYWVTRVYPPEFISPIDYRPLFKFIPSKAEDNPHLPAEYYNILNTLPEHLRAAFRDGSWDVFQGQAFTFMRETHVIDPRPIPAHAPIYTTFDWGFGAPFSWGWWWVDADGRIYRFAEFYGWNGTPNQGLRWEDSRIADEIKRREAELSERYDIDFSRAIRKAGPDCFQKKPDYKGGGQGPSTAETFAAHGIYLSPGDASRAIKIRQFRERLAMPKDGSPPMMLVYSTCDQFIRTIPDIVVNPNNPEDVDDKGEDHCLHGDTLVCTDQGNFPIRELVGKVGRVLTVDGTYTEYHNCRKTQSMADVIEVYFSDGRSIISTADHKYMTTNGKWVYAKNLLDEECHIMITSPVKNTEVFLCPRQLLMKKLKNLTGSVIGYVAFITRGRASDYTELCGKVRTGKFLKVMRSIIKTTTDQIIKLKTLFYCLVENTHRITLNYLTMQDGWIPCTEEPQNGTEAMRGVLGINGNMNQYAPQRLKTLLLKRIANIAELNIQALSIQGSVPVGVSKSHGKKMIARVLSRCASFAESSLHQMEGRIKGRVLDRVALGCAGQSVSPVRIEPAGKEDVYCLDVAHSSHAFAVCGGVIVHNCYDEACHICMARPLSLKIPPRLKTEAQAHIDMITKPTPRDPMEIEDAHAAILDHIRTWEQEDELIYTRGGTYSDVDGR